MRNAMDWWLLSYDCMIRVSMVLLTGKLPPTRVLTRADAMSAIESTLGWLRTLSNNPTWMPREGK